MSISPDPNIVFTGDDPRRGGRFGCSDKKEPEVNPPSTSPPRQITRNGRNDDSQFFNGRKAIVSSDSDTGISSRINGPMPVISQKIIVTPRDDRGDDSPFPAPKDKIGHRHTSKDTSRTGDSTREKYIKSNSRIPW